MRIFAKVSLTDTNASIFMFTIFDMVLDVVIIFEPCLIFPVRLFCDKMLDPMIPSKPNKKNNRGSKTDFFILTKLHMNKIISAIMHTLWLFKAIKNTNNIYFQLALWSGQSQSSQSKLGLILIQQLTGGSITNVKSQIN